MLRMHWHHRLSDVNAVHGNSTWATYSPRTVSFTEPKAFYSENGGLAVKIKFLGYLEGMAPKLLYHSDK